MTETSNYVICFHNSYKESSLEHKTSLFGIFWSFFPVLWQKLITKLGKYNPKPENNNHLFSMHVSIWIAKILFYNSFLETKYQKLIEKYFLDFDTYTCPIYFILFRPVHFHTVILQYWNIEKRTLSNFAFQHCQGLIGTLSKKNFWNPARDSWGLH